MQIFIMFKCCLGFVVAVFCLVGVFLCLFFFFWLVGFGVFFFYRVNDTVRQDLLHTADNLNSIENILFSVSLP